MADAHSAEQARRPPVDDRPEGGEGEKFSGKGLLFLNTPLHLPYT